MKNAIIETLYIILEKPTHIQQYLAPRVLNGLNYIDFGSLIFTMAQVFFYPCRKGLNNLPHWMKKSRAEKGIN